MGDVNTRRRQFLGGVAVAGAAAITDSGYLMANSNRSESSDLSRQRRKPFGFVIHGGAGTILRNKMTPETERAYIEALTHALNLGYNILKGGGHSLDAVETAIRFMEDSPLFNAGIGAVFTNAGTNELDASIMDGSNLKAGAVATLQHIKNPIHLARMVMEKSPHVMMVAEGAETFARQQGIEMVPNSYFRTERRWKEYLDFKAKESGKPAGKSSHPETGDEKHGTVGAAALDREGNLAAGTSTGGISNKKFGRVGDSPIIGAGTYANNLTCAVSATGDGEFFIRSVVAHDISALIQYANKSVVDAAQTVIDKVGKLGGTGGVIVMDRYGNLAKVFNTPGMYRGEIDENGKVVVEIYRD